jgi:conjugal transfer ATP-binding protein TraC
MKKALKGEPAAQLLTPLGYDDESRLFYCADQSLAFGFVCRPLSAGDDKAADRLNVLLKDDWPPDTIMQFCLIASDNLRSELAEMLHLREGLKDPFLAELIHRRAAFLEKGARRPVVERTGLRVRNFQLVATVKIPIGEPMPALADFELARSVRIRTKAALQLLGFHPITMTAQRWLEVMGPLLNRSHLASWRRDGGADYDPESTLAAQVWDYDSCVTPDEKGLRLGVKGNEDYVRTFSIKRMPARLPFGAASNLIGDLWEGTRGIRTPFVLTANLFFPDAHNTKEGINTSSQWVDHQAFGQMMKWIPRLGERKRDFDILKNSLNEGDRPLKIYLGLSLYTDSADEIEAVSASVQAYWSEIGFSLLPDHFISLPAWLTMLPLGGEKEAVRDLMRHKTMTSRQAVALLPIFGDWRGTGTPMFNLVSRNGQLMSVSPYDSGTNFNLCIAAASGSGKSFLTNELILSALSMGGQVWVIDVGRSYEKLCDILGGDFVHFGQDTNAKLNPFPLVSTWEEDEDVLVSLVAAMAAPTDGLNDLQTQWLKKAMREIWDQIGKEMTVHDIVERLRSASEVDGDLRLRDMADQLYSFSNNGQYGKYFNGDNNVTFKSRFTVLELEELKGRRHLQQVVLLQLIFQIQQEMYLGERGRPKIVIIDEAWDLLGHGDVAKFIEHGYRRFRKYGGCAVTITQGVNDLYAAATGRAIVENSANLYLLGQKPEAIEQLRGQGKLPLTDGGYDLLKTVHTDPGKYSEIFLLTDYGSGVGKLVVDQFIDLAPVQRLP